MVCARAEGPDSREKTPDSCAVALFAREKSFAAGAETSGAREKVSDAREKVSVAREKVSVAREKMTGAWEKTLSAGSLSPMASRSVPPAVAGGAVSQMATNAVVFIRG